MALIKISKFAMKHNVSRESIYAAIKDGRLKKKKIDGTWFIESTQKYNPICNTAKGR